MSVESKSFSGGGALRRKKHQAWMIDDTIYLRKSQLPADQTGIYASGICFDKLVWLFGVGCFVGFVCEIIFCMVYHGYYQTKQGMIYGPFNQLYGFGAIAMVLVLAPLIHKKPWQIFAVGAVVGGVFEYTCSLVQEYIIGTRPWDFSDQFLHFDGRTSILFMLFWGALACFLMYVLYPSLSYCIQRIPMALGKISTWVILVFFVVNMGLSLLAVYRWEERRQDIPSQNAVQEFFDSRYPDERLMIVFPNMESTRK